MDQLQPLPSTPTREQILRLEGELLALEGAGLGLQIQTRHYFSPGLYAREVFIPAGTVLTGATHKTEHLVLFAGDITVWHEGAMVRLTGHHTRVSTPGAKRVGFAHADTYCTAFFATDETDPAALERLLVEEPEQLQTHRARLALAGGELESLEG